MINFLKYILLLKKENALEQKKKREIKIPSKTKITTPTCTIVKKEKKESKNG